MPSKFRIRFIFKPFVNLIANGLIKIGVTPNLATVYMLFFSILSCFSLALLRNLLLFAIFVFLTGILDGCDGAIARKLNKSTKFGGFFDSFMDRFSEFFIFLGLLIFQWNQLLWNLIDTKLIIYISFSISIMISYCRARAEVFFKGDFDIGLMARSERLFYLFITMIVAYFYGFTSEMLFIFMWLVLSTFVFRVISIYYMIKKRNSNVKT
ncbi:MAG: CDP-alcohol phosphatidyltransferase family protein [Promethearchaeota archaeon]|jgi:archaetidylinositol phosphate synthase